jgi:hypothetical protein
MRAASALLLLFVSIGVGCGSDPPVETPQPVATGASETPKAPETPEAPRATEASEKQQAWYPQRHPEATLEKVDDAQSLIILPGKPVETLNGTGARVYDLIDGTRAPEDIARAIVGEFEIDYATAEKDVYTLLGELETKGLLAEPVPGEFRERAGLSPS